MVPSIHNIIFENIVKKSYTFIVTYSLNNVSTPITLAAATLSSQRRSLQLWQRRLWRAKGSITVQIILNIVFQRMWLSKRLPVRW